MTSRLPKDWLPPIARRQSGLFTSAQAVAAGATPAQVRHRCDSGQWVTVVGDALARVGHSGGAWSRAQAAALTWPDAVVCFGSAAALHHLPVPADEWVHVVVPNRRPSRGRLRTHELRLSDDEILRRGTVRLTSLTRTLFDCIGRLPPDAADSLVAWAVTRERLDVAELERVLALRPRWWGNTRRRQAVADATEGALSVAERRLHILLRESGITGWAGDQRVYAGTVLIGRADVLFPAERLIIEVDGFRFHGKEQFQSDRTRQNMLVAAGYTVLRFTWADLTERPRDAVAQIRTMLLALRRSPTSRSDLRL